MLDVEELRLYRHQSPWDAANQCLRLFPYWTEEQDPIRKLISDLKNEDFYFQTEKLKKNIDEKINLLVELLYELVKTHSSELFENYDSLKILSIPSHRKGFSTYTSEEICRRLAGSMPYRLCHLERFLNRTETLAPAHNGSGPRGFELGYRTLVCNSIKLEPKQSILIFDDVKTSGNTFAAAKSRVSEAAGCHKSQIFGLFIAQARPTA